MSLSLPVLQQMISTLPEQFTVIRSNTLCQCKRFCGNVRWGGRWSFLNTEKPDLKAFILKNCIQLRFKPVFFFRSVFCVKKKSSWLHVDSWNWFWAPSLPQVSGKLTWLWMVLLFFYFSHIRCQCVTYPLLDPTNPFLTEELLPFYLIIYCPLLNPLTSFPQCNANPVPFAYPYAWPALPLSFNQ